VSSGSGVDQSRGTDQAANDPGRNESEAQRVDRNMAELLQELRVAGLGIQVLFGFLLSIPFTNRFEQLSSTQRVVYMLALMLAAVATALLLAPVAYHRLLFRHNLKGAVLRVANTSAILGLVTVSLAVSATVLLDVSFVEQGAIVPALTIGVVALFAGLWFVFPLSRRIRSDR
jgi:hypothetical protein